MRNSSLAILSAVLFTAILAGCDGETPEPGETVPDGRSSMTIGVMPKLVGIGYFDATQKGAEEAAKELGITLIYDGPTEARSEDQIRMINTWLTQGVDVLAVAPNDPEAVSKTLKEARELGSDVITWDTDANAKLSERTAFVNQADNDELGRALVQLMVDGVKGRGELLEGDYLIVSGTATASNQNTWIEIMHKVIAEKHPEMNMLQHLTPGEDQQKAYEQTTEALGANPKLKGIWGITSVALPAAAKACRDGSRKEVYVTGLSLPDLMREYVKDGSVDRFLLWDAVDLGYLTVHVAHALSKAKLESGKRDFGRLKGIEVRDGEVLLGPPLVFDEDNIDEYHF